MWARMCNWWWLKALGTTAVIWVFFILYFELLSNPTRPATVMPLTAIDHLLPLQPPLIFAYFSLWVYVGIAPGVQWRFLPLFVYGLWAMALCVTGLALFYFFPTEVPHFIRHHADFPGFGLLRGIDAAGNACPSMHVAAAVFSAWGLHDVLRRVRTPAVWRYANGLWCLAIVYSTLAVKQHVLLDVVAGGLLGAIFAAAAQRWRPATEVSLP
jgi:membrane-associated phospholipid phosphatase